MKRDNIRKERAAAYRRITLVVLTALLAILIAQSAAAQACVTPTEDMIIRDTTRFCTGTYNLQDANSNGAIRIGKSNIVLDCNGATIAGADRAGSKGIMFYDGGAHTNVTIKNCNIRDYDRGITFYNSKQLIIMNNIISSNNYGIMMSHAYSGAYGYVKILSNTISGSSNTGIYIEGGVRHNISNNIIRDGLTQGIDLVHLNNSYAKGNTIQNHENGGIRVCANKCYYNVIDSNTISGSDWNCIDAEGYYGNFSNNKLSSCAHSAIDMCGGTHNTVNSGYNNIFNNKVNGTGIYICIGVFNKIYGNNITDVKQNNVGASFGIGVVGSIAETRGNRIYGNVIKNISGDCILSSSTSNTWEGNTLSLCQTSSVRISNWWEDTSQVNNDSFKDNVYPDGYATFISDNGGQMNYAVNEQSASFHRIGLSSNRFATFNYSGTKNFRVTGNTVSIYNQLLNFPYNDVVDSTTLQVIAANINNYAIALGTGRKITIGNFVNTVLNVPPLTPTATIYSRDDTTDSDVYCSSRIDDLNGDLLRVDLEWYKNNTLYLSRSYSNRATGTTFSEYLSKSNLAVNDLIKCRIRLYDGQSYGNWSTSYNIRIRQGVGTPSNTPPSDPSPEIYSHDDTIESDVHCTSVITDLDDDILDVKLEWYKNGTLYLTDIYEGYESDTVFDEYLARSHLSVGDRISCKMQLDDGTDYSGSVSSGQILIRAPQGSNTAPNTPSARIYSADDTTNSDVHCMSAISDQDEDALTVELAWYKNYAQYITRSYPDRSSGTVFDEYLDKSNLAANDLIQCRVRLYDGQSYSNWSTSYNIRIR